MKNPLKQLFTLALLVGAVCLSSCEFARFDRIPGPRAQQIPSTLQGTFELRTKVPLSGTLTDSVIFSVSDYKIAVTTAGTTKEYLMGRDFYVHNYLEYFLLEMPDKTYRELKNMVIIEQVKNGIKVYPVWGNSSTPGVEPSKIGDFFQPHPFQMHHDQLGLKPELNEGLSDNSGPGGGENVNTSYYQMEDEQFSTYFEKELKNRKYFFIPKLVVAASLKSKKK